MRTFDYKNIQKLSNYDDLFITTNTPGTIVDFTRTQSTEVYTLESTYTLTFQPLNRIGKNGMITLEWSDQVQFIEKDAVCKVETSEVFNEACTFDFEKKSIKIINTFKNVDTYYFSPITIVLEKIKNPVNNIGLDNFKLRTYDDTAKEFAIDMLDYLPLTPCNYPCERCSTDKDYCFECWDDQPERFLMTTKGASTCKTKCDDGFTSNGDPDKVCTRCDAACATCEDFG
jgi:hypothetical protein